MNKSEFLSKLSQVNRPLSRKDIKAIISNAISVKWGGGEKSRFSNGEDEKLVIAMEELGELTQAISKFMRYGNNRTDVLEEMADVRVAMYTIQEIVGINDELLDNAVTVKLNRIKNRTQSLKE